VKGEWEREQEKAGVRDGGRVSERKSGSGSGERECVWRESGERTAVVVTAKSGGGGGW